MENGETNIHVSLPMNETERISRAIAREHARLDQLYVDIESTKTRITELEMRLRGNSATQFSKENDIDSELGTKR